MVEQTKAKKDMPVVRFCKGLSWMAVLLAILSAVIRFSSWGGVKTSVILFGFLVIAAVLRLLAVLTQIVLDSQSLLHSDLKQGVTQLTDKIGQLTEKIEQLKGSAETADQTIIEKIIQATERINIITRDSETISQKCDQLTREAKEISQYCRQLNCDSKDVNKNIFSMHDFFEKIARRLDIDE